MCAHIILYNSNGMGGDGLEARGGIDDIDSKQNKAKGENELERSGSRRRVWFAIANDLEQHDGTKESRNERKKEECLRALA